MVTLALLAAVGWLLRRASRPGGGGVEAPAPPLEAWELLGCWSVRVEPWYVTPAAEGEEPGGRFASPGGGGLPASFAPPDTVMLLPDSVDRWGRALPSYRVAPRSAAAAGRAGRHVRWLVSGDTLWLLWSEGDTRAGLALRSSGDSLVGRARALSGADSMDASARASATRVNCSTGEREGRGSGRRRR